MSREAKILSYEWMVKYTPQEAWITGKGLFLWLAFFLTEIFAGVYFISIFLGFGPGLITGWLGSLVLGGFFHMLYLGKASRGWRILMKFGNSELSRGLWIIGFFGGFGFLQIVPVVVPGLLPWNYDSSALNVINGILSILVISHGFTTMFVVRALPMWNSSMMLPLSLASGLWVGSQITTFLASLAGADVPLAESWARWTLLLFGASLLLYLFGTYHTSENAKASIKRLFAGDLSILFYIWVIIIGFMIPLIITLVLWDSVPGTGVLFLRLICVLIGDGAMRYGIMKAPLYTPLL